MDGDSSGLAAVSSLDIGYVPGYTTSCLLVPRL